MEEKLSWTALEYENKKRGRDWIWYVGLVTVIASTLAFFYKNFFFGILLILSGAMLILLSLRKPRTIEITISKDEITIDAKTLKFEEIKKFWLDETGKQSKLLLLTGDKLVPISTVLLENVRSEDIRNKLSPSIEESFLRESTIDKIFEKLGF